MLLLNRPVNEKHYELNIARHFSILLNLVIKFPRWLRKRRQQRKSDKLQFLLHEKLR